MRAFVFALSLAFATPAFPLASAFTYQGVLQDAGVPANGSYDLQFTLQTAAGAPLATQLRDDVAVQRGLLTMELDFGPLTGADYLLQVAVRPGASTGAFTPLSPAMRMRPTPQAQVAGMALEAVTVSPASIASASIADGSVGAADIDAAQVQRRVAAACASNEAIRTIAADGSVTCVVAPTGPAGADGTLRVYGNASKGDLIVDGNDPVTLDEANLQYRNITVAAGKQLYVPSGATLRATGTVTIEGELNALSGAMASNVGVTGHSPALPVTANYFGNAASSGDGDAVPTRTPGGDPVNNTVSGNGGVGGRALLAGISNPARVALRPAFVGGGAGGSSGGAGGEGGGFVAIVAQGPIVIRGSVTAAGRGGNFFGGGGGGGGIVVLASRVSIENRGTVHAGGGGGAGAGYGSTAINELPLAYGAGGGGGGGIVHLVAPAVTTGAVIVSGGPAGAAPAPSPTFSATAAEMQAIGGGGGGSCYGRGGSGAQISGTTGTRRYTTAPAGQPGEPGIVFTTLADPTSLL